MKLSRSREESPQSEMCLSGEPNGNLVEPNESGVEPLDPPKASANTPRSLAVQGDWQHTIAEAIRDRDELLQYVGLKREESAESVDVADSGFPIFVTRPFANRIAKSDPGDPLLRQVLPLSDESVATMGFGTDPVGDQNAALSGGLLKKYEGRALVLTTAACPVHCRYCFRRDFPYQQHSGRKDRYQTALAAIAADSSIHEVILSGGDPWMLDDASLDQLMSGIESIGHVRRLRIHTRMPIFVPTRVSETLMQRTKESRLSTWLVLHSNHSNEFDHEVDAAVDRMRQSGIQLLNQSVLLQGVNDNVETLVELSETLIDRGIQPYYLHQLDRAQGTAHFEVDPAKGIAMINAMRKKLPGYAVPLYVKENEGEASKTPLG